MHAKSAHPCALSDRAPNTLVFLFFAALFFFQVFLISPQGEFPLIDDWTHAISVRAFLEEGHLFYPHWLSTFSYIPIGLGIIAGKIFGFSFTLFRCTTLAFAFSSVVFFYLLLRSHKLSLSASMASTLLLAANPIFLKTSYTFMTDIYGLFFVTSGAYFLDRGFATARRSFLLAGIACAVLGFYTRQLPILLLPAASFLAYRHYHFSFRRTLLWFSVPLLVLVASIPLLGHFDLLPGEMAGRIPPPGTDELHHISQQFLMFILLLSFFLLPATLSLLVRNVHWLRRPIFLALLFLSLLLGWNTRHAAFAFGVSGDHVTRSGLGPMTAVLQGEVPLWGPDALYTGLHVLSFVSGVILCYAFVALRTLRHAAHEKMPSVLPLFGALYFLVLLPVNSFDRYLLLLLPTVLFFVTRLLHTTHWSGYVFTVVLLFLALYSGIGTYNNLAWNRARWTLGERLHTEGVPIEAIEGGYEWDGWYFYERTQREPLGPATRAGAPWYVFVTAPGHPETYVLSFSPLPGYTVIDAERVRGVFSNISCIYANKKIAGAP